MYSPTDRMEMAPIMKLIDKDFICALKEHSDDNVKELSCYLNIMRKFYFLFRDITLTNLKKQIISEKLYKHFSDWKTTCNRNYANSLTKELFDHIVISLNSLRLILLLVSR